MKYDLAVVGNDEAAFELMTAAASAGQQVIAVLPEHSHSAWLCEQAMRRMIMQMQADGFNVQDRLKASLATPTLLKRLLRNAIAIELNDRLQQLQDVEILFGQAYLISSGGLIVSGEASMQRTIVEASNLAIGTGVRFVPRSTHREQFALMAPESLLNSGRLPGAVDVLGGGSFGLGLAALLSHLGVRVTCWNDADTDDVMHELAECSGVQFCSGEQEWEHGEYADMRRPVVDCRRHRGLTDCLNLRSVGVEPDEDGRLWCNDDLQTWSPTVYALGDVVGFSSCTASSAEQQAAQVVARIRQQGRVRRPHYLAAMERILV